MYNLAKKLMFMDEGWKALEDHLRRDYYFRYEKHVYVLTIRITPMYKELILTRTYCYISGDTLTEEMCNAILGDDDGWLLRYGQGMSFNPAKIESISEREYWSFVL